MHLAEPERQTIGNLNDHAVLTRIRLSIDHRFVNDFHANGEYAKRLRDLTRSRKRPPVDLADEGPAARGRKAFPMPTLRLLMSGLF
jgi:hypothetical protein